MKREVTGPTSITNTSARSSRDTGRETESDIPMFEIEGGHTTATVMGERELFDETFVEQVQRIVDHEAFTEPIRVTLEVMSDVQT